MTVSSDSWAQHGGGKAPVELKGSELLEVWYVSRTGPDCERASAVRWDYPLRWRRHPDTVIGRETAETFLHRAADLMAERGKQYDQPAGERSMGRAVAAFNAVTGRELTEAEGWLLMLMVKQVRQWQRPGFHRDSAEDGVAYAALLAEALASDER